MLKVDDAYNAPNEESAIHLTQMHEKLTDDTDSLMSHFSNNNNAIFLLIRRDDTPSILILFSLTAS
jgi:hypothetical protein